MLRLLILMLCVTVMALATVGCQNPNDPVNNAMEKFSQATTAVFNKAGKDSVVNSGQLTGDMELKQPGYHYTGLVMFGTAVFVDGEIYLKGIEGKMAGGLSLVKRPDEMPVFEPPPQPEAPKPPPLSVTPHE